MSFAPRVGAFPALDPAERDRRRREAIDAADPAALWVFAYGSLMWNPCFEPEERRVATVHGHRRRFCILTTRARGTPQRPGLGLGLEASGGECVGIAYRLRPRSIERDMEALFEREMATGVYEPTWLDAYGESGATPTLAFVVDRAHPQYVGGMSLADMVETMHGARGRYGTCRDYLASTVETLAGLGVREPELDTLLSLVDAR